MTTTELLALMLSRIPEKKQRDLLLVFFGMNLDDYMSVLGGET